MTKHELSILVKAVGAGVGFIVGLMGGWDKALEALIILIVLDYATGVLIAICGKSRKTNSGYFNSAVGLNGIVKKLFMLAAVVVAYVADKLVGSVLIHETVVFLFIANEAKSILENAALMGVPLPPQLLNIFDQMHIDNEKKLGEIAVKAGFLTPAQRDTLLTMQDELDKQSKLKLKAKEKCKKGAEK